MKVLEYQNSDPMICERKSKNELSFGSTAVRVFFGRRSFLLTNHIVPEKDVTMASIIVKKKTKKRSKQLYQHYVKSFLRTSTKSQCVIIPFTVYNQRSVIQHDNYIFP